MESSEHYLMDLSISLPTVSLKESGYTFVQSHHLRSEMKKLHCCRKVSPSNLPIDYFDNEYDYMPSSENLIILMYGGVYPDGKRD